MIPDYQSIMLPLLKTTGDKKEHTIQEVRDSLAKYFNLTEEERSKLLSKSKHQIFNNKVGWARTYLKKAGLLDYTQKAHFKITDRGLKVLQEKPSKINVKYLNVSQNFLNLLSHQKR